MQAGLSQPLCAADPTLSGILGWSATMRWLVIGLLVSLGMLLFAAGALARHIWLQRKKLRRDARVSRDAGETDLEIEP